MRFDRATTSELTCTYIVGSVLEIVGILVTVDVLYPTWGGTVISAGGWTKWRGPTVLICGILLGLIATIVWLHVPSASH